LRVPANQNVEHGFEPGIAQVFLVLMLVMPSLLAFLVSKALDSSWATMPGLWICYKISLNIGYGAIPVALGLTALAVYGRESSPRSTLTMAAVSLAGIVFTWYAGQL
jgi:hypothetical protein